MTSKSKWLTILGGLLVTILLSGIFSGLWFIYFIVVLTILLIPNEKATPQAQTFVAQVAVDGQIAGAIREKIAAATDEQYRAGLQAALDIVNGSPQVQTIATPVTLATPVIQQPLSEEELQLHKEKQDQQNTNTILYVASFLLVGAAVLFIGTGLDSVAKFIGILVITVAFYGAGIMLFKLYDKLRPAAIAFTGTGLALVPFVGLAMYNYVLPDGPMVWFLTSAIGLILYLYATVVIKHQVLGYLSAAFVFSLTTSYISIISVPFVWYFVTIILTGSLLGYLAYKKPSWLPSYLHEPLETNGLFATPLAVVGSLAVSDRLNLQDYEIIVGVSTLYYLVMSLGLSSSRKLIYWSVGRAGFIVLALIATYDITKSYNAVGITLGATAIAAMIYSMLHRERQYENIWLPYPQLAIVGATCMWFGDWSNVTYGLLLLGLVSTAQLVKLRNVGYGLGLLLACMLVPLTTVIGVAQFTHSAEAIAGITIFIAVCATIVRYGLSHSDESWKMTLSALYGLLLTESLLSVSMTNDPGWIASIGTIAAVVLFCASFLERSPILHVVSNLVGVFSVWKAVEYFGYDPLWQPLLTAIISAVIFYSFKLYYEANDPARKEIMFGSALSVLVFGALMSAAHDETVVAASLVGCLAAAMLAYEGFKVRNLAYYETAIIIATLALQRLVSVSYDEVNFLVYTHWWAASIAAMAYIRYVQGTRQDAKSRGVIALAVLSVPTGLAALTDPDTYQLLFLVEHLVLTIAGYVQAKKLVLRWGVAGITLALFYMLMGYTYVLLFLAALGLIALAVWRLLRKQT